MERTWGAEREEGVEVARLFLTTDLRVLLHVQPTVHAKVASTGDDAEAQQPIQYARLPNQDDALDRPPLVGTNHQEQLKLGTFDLPVFMQSQYAPTLSIAFYSFLLSHFICY
jgi:hypothetical protein